jgi:hypothetical protein
MQMPESRYEHVQPSALRWILHAVIIAIATYAIFIVGPTIAEKERILVWTILAFACVTILISSEIFTRLTVRDEGDVLAIRFGPIPLVSKRIPYEMIAKVELARSNIIDGWGIHSLPRRGTIWNVWGFDCIRLTLNNGKKFRLGTDDQQALFEFLKEQITERE